MNKLSGDAAEAALAEAWEKILGQDPAGQEIIHVLAQPPVEPGWIAESGIFQAWLENGCEASDDLWRSFAKTARHWPYIVNARRAAAAGIPNTRIFVMRRDGWYPAPPWKKYLAKVHLPAISALSGETFYQVWAEDCEDAGIDVRDYDVNLFGAAGVMLAGGDNGDVEWRAFLDGRDRLDLSFRRESRFVTSVRDLAVSLDRTLIGFPEISALMLSVDHEGPGPGDDIVPGARP